MNDNSEDDWRLQGQENYLKGVKLIAHEYQQMQVDLVDGRCIIVDVAKFPSIKKLSMKDRKDWYRMDNGFTFDKCSEVIHIEQILGNFQKYCHEN